MIIDKKYYSIACISEILSFSQITLNLFGKRLYSNSLTEKYFGS